MRSLHIFLTPFTPLIRQVGAGALLVVLALFSPAANAQCPTNIYSSNQQLLENLMEGNEDCTHIAGNVWLFNFTDLTPLSNIQSIGGDLVVQASYPLTSFSGLGALTQIGGSFILNISMTSIQSFEGLESLQSIGGNLHVLNVEGVQSLAGLEALTHVTGDIRIGNTDVVSLDGLQNLLTVGGNFYVEDCDQLTSVAGLTGLERVEGELRFTGCPMLTTVDNINALTYAGLIGIAYNDNLVSIAGFEMLTGVGEDPDGTSLYEGVFIDNPILETVTGFINLQSAGRFYLVGSCRSLLLPNLETCTGDFILRTNGEGAHAISELEIGNLKSVGRHFQLSLSLPDLPDFPMLESVGGHFLIDSRESLEVLDGFNALETIGSGQLGWGFDLYEHDQLTAISGFQSLREIEGDFVISQCDALVSVSAFQGLESVGGFYAVTQNASLIDCSPFCPFLENGIVGETKSVKWNGGDDNSPCWREAEVEFNCSFDLRLIDVNPEFYHASIPEDLAIENLTIEQAQLLETTRDGLVADGITKVIVALEVPEEGRIDLQPESEGFSTPWGTGTREVDDRHIAYLLYTAPETFDPGEEPTYVYEDTVLVFDLTNVLEYVTDQGQRHSVGKAIRIVRPPVILMHGTFDNPMEAWQTKFDDPAAGTETFQRALEKEKYCVFAVDYQSTNGDSDSGPSSFMDNRLVLRSNPGGIENALEYYRDELKIATTQVDVVGHSMGGVLPRVYASIQYNGDYYNPRNFWEGDINRLITIAGSHFGSHLGELQIEMEDATLIDLGPLDWILTQVQNFILKWYTGTAASDAVRDQRPAPGGTALALIGNTDIPSHAITGSVPVGALKDPVRDPMQEYYDLYWYTELLLYYNSAIRENYLQYKLDLAELGFGASTTWDGEPIDDALRLASDAILFKDMIDDAIKQGGKILEAIDGEFELPSNIEIFSYALNETGMSDINVVDPLLFLFEASADPVGVVTDFFFDAVMPSEEEIRTALESTHDKSIEGMRSLIFNNDANDGVVRVESQRGDIGEAYSTHFDHVFHGFAPRYTEIQDRVITLLGGGMSGFNMDGFPAPDHVQPLYLPPSGLDLYRPPLSGAPAVCQSGMVPEHARAFASVADQRNTIIIVRPVNPDATPLIAKGAATKVMDVKPKSSNWGPQKGYLPVDQRYSKLWKLFEGNERENKIDTYNEKVAENLNAMLVATRPLQIEICNATYNVHIDKNQLMDDCAENDVVLVPVHDPSMVCYWGDNICSASGYVDFSYNDLITDCVESGVGHDLIPFEVIATVPADGEPSNFITADYDLLMIGFYAGEDLEYTQPEEVDFQPGTGQIKPDQQDLIEVLNAAVNHSGGDVVHHGPENQFSLSPYIDYPLTVFAPDDIPGPSSGKVLSLSMGDRGFRDIELKQYVNRMRAEGYDLYDNPVAPGWHWEWNETFKGFLLEDSPLLGDYVEQMPKRSCDKQGNEENTICISTEPTASTSTQRPQGWLTGSRSPQGGFSLTVHPNLVAGNSFSMVIEAASETTIQLVISDVIGMQRQLVTVEVAAGTNEVDLSLRGDLDSGVYTITVVPMGVSQRFIKL